MNNSNITTNPTNAASASVTNKVILNMTNNLYGSSSPLTSQINMISNLQKSAFQTTTAKPNATLIPLHNSVPTSIATNLSTPITLVPANQATTPAGMNSPSSSAYGGFGEYMSLFFKLTGSNFYIFNELKHIVAIVGITVSRLHSMANQSYIAQLLVKME